MNNRLREIWQLVKQKRLSKLEKRLACESYSREIGGSVLAEVQHKLRRNKRIRRLQLNLSSMALKQ